VLIDWFTVAAQIVNFLVLVALLKHFLYGRIIEAMNMREERIASRLTEAAQTKIEAVEELEAYQQKNADLERQRSELLDQADKEAEARKKVLLAEARDAVTRVQAKWQEAVEQEKALFLRELRARASGQIFAVTRRILQDMANAGLEEQIIEAFIQRLSSLEAAEQQALAQSLSMQKSVVVTSAFEIPDRTRRRIAGIVEGYAGDGLAMDYRLDPEVVLGIELKTPGRKIAWSLDYYLDSLEANLREALEGQNGKAAALP
jgi:F-type H+-transporting ATPase subunit b